MSAEAGRSLTALRGSRDRSERAPRPRLVDGPVDEWGAADRWVGVGRALAGLRWDVELHGAGRLSRRDGALLVTNPRPWAMVPPMVALTVGAHLGRTVRFSGLLDVPPASLVLRRTGAVLARDDEIETALRSGEIVVAGAAGPSPWHPGSWWPFGGGRDAGAVSPGHVAAARRATVPVHPVAVTTSALGRGVRVEVLAPVRPRLDHRAPLAAADLADRVAERLQLRLDELGEHG